MGIVIRQSLKGTFVNYIGVILGVFVQMFIVAKYVDPETLGLTKVLYEVAFFLSSLALLGSGSTGMRFFPYFKDKETGNHGFLFYYMLMPIVGIAAITLLYSLLRGSIVEYFSNDSPLFGEYDCYVIPLMLVLTLWVWSENYANIHMRIAIPKAIREIGMRILMLIVYVAFGKQFLDLNGLILGFIVCYGICMLAAGTYSLCVGCRTLTHDWNFLSHELRGKILRYSGFLMLSTISGNIMAQLDLFMLSSEEKQGLYSAGVYTMIIFMVEFVNMPTRNITPISTPLAANAMKENNLAEAKKLYQQVSVHQMLASTVLLLLIWVNLDNIFAIMPNGDKYAAGKWALLFLGFSKVIYGTLNFGNTLISFSKYYYWTLIITIILTFLTIGTNLYFIPLLGISGAALATLIASVLSYSYQQFLVQTKIKTNPFTWSHLRIMVTIATLYGINYLIPSLSHISPWLDGAVRTLLLATICLVIVYKLKISPQINGFIYKRFLNNKRN